MRYQPFTVFRVSDGATVGHVEAQDAQEAVFRLMGGAYGRADYTARTGSDRPMAAPGLTSYRYRNGAFGFVMIGARDRDEALREAARSVTGGEVEASRLEVWDARALAYRPAN